eukprot:8011879-Pyramimonas_sp.AAC.1
MDTLCERVRTLEYNVQGAHLVNSPPRAMISPAPGENSVCIGLLTVCADSLAVRVDPFQPSTLSFQHADIG